MSVADHQLDVMLSKGVLTGSRKFNVHKTDSDYDIIIKQSDVPKDLEATSWDYYVCFDGSKEEPSDADGIDQDNWDSWYEGSKVWGETLISIIKYYPEDPNDECEYLEDQHINLFIYDDSHTNIYDKFRTLNAQMLFTMSTEQLAHRPTRVERFAELLIDLEISEGD